jgi:hypothetical protein
VKNRNYHPDWIDSEDVTDDYETDIGSNLDVPKRSSIRRKERFRAREFVADLGRRSRRSRRKHRRQSIRTDSEFWEV